MPPPSIFSRLTVQSRLLAGEVAIGDTPDLVKIAWGEPNRETSMITSSDKVRLTWT